MREAIRRGVDERGNETKGRRRRRNNEEKKKRREERREVICTRRKDRDFLQEGTPVVPG